MALKLSPLLVFIMLLWLLFPAYAEWTSSTNTTCVTTLLQGVCNATTVDNSTTTATCCNQILRESQINKEKCLCSAFEDDVNFVAGFRLYCSSTVIHVLTFCQNASLLTSPPTSNTFSPPPPADTLANSTIPANSTTPVTSNDTTSGKKGNTSITLIVVPVIVIAVLGMIVTFIICIRKCKNSKQNKYSSDDYSKLRKDQVSLSQSSSSGHASLPPTPMSNVSRGLNLMNKYKAEIKPNKVDFKSEEPSLIYDFAILEAATNNFSVDNRIGEGGFGTVHKGILVDGRKIAVKRLSVTSNQGEKEFKSEIELLAKLKHVNVVELFGFCSVEGQQSLVYELVTNRSLDVFLFDAGKPEAKVLEWSIRFKIIKEITEGMVYLHHHSPGRTIHRDLKAANILLDENMNPKIGDFGLARQCAFDQTRAQTDRPCGTDGYMAPDYGGHQYSLKTDVYAFGVLVLEIISGKRVISITRHHSGTLCKTLLIYAWQCWADDNPLALVDPLMRDLYSKDEVVRCIHLGLSCVQDEPTKRPDMLKIQRILNFNPDSAILDKLIYPEYLYYSGPNQSTTSSREQPTTASASSGAISSLAKSELQIPN